MQPSEDSTVPTRRVQTAAWNIAGWSLVLAACLATLTYLALLPGPLPPALTPAPQLPESREALERAKFFDEEVQPALAAADSANREAADRCIQRIRDGFDKYREGIEPFVDDLTSYGTRLAIARRMPADWWYKNSAVQQFMMEKFETHLFSEASLKQGIEGALDKFREDIEANKHALLASVRAAVSRSDLPDPPEVDYGQFSADVSTNCQDFVAKSAQKSVYELLVTELVSGTASTAAGSIVAAVAVRVVTMAATASATAGGATAGGTAAGGAGGSFVGPVGTVVGGAVGLLTGVLIDWWMTSTFQAELTEQLNEIIDTVESLVILGGSDGPGLEHALAEYCDVLRDASSQSLYKRITEEPNP